MLSPSSITSAAALLFAIAGTVLPQGTNAQFRINRDALTTGPCGNNNEFVNPVNLPKATTITISSYVEFGSYTVSIGYPSGIRDLQYIPLVTDVIPDSLLPRNLPFNLTSQINLDNGPPGTMSTPDIPAIIQVVLESDGKRYYQCADVIVESSTSLPPRNDAGLQSIPNLQPTDSTSVPFPSGPSITIPSESDSVSSTSIPATRPATTTATAALSTRTSSPTTSAPGATTTTSKSSASDLLSVGSLCKAVVAGAMVAAVGAF
ncbi:hypothetical protein BC829DRAFT_380729 [Chytridium lagenaria]|nr:hypothetical protein BC829DRAFT_380729 [Chytridium lagenaria]